MITLYPNPNPNLYPDPQTISSVFPVSPINPSNHNATGQPSLPPGQTPPLATSTSPRRGALNRRCRLAQRTPPPLSPAPTDSSSNQRDPDSTTEPNTQTRSPALPVPPVNSARPTATGPPTPSGPLPLHPTSQANLPVTSSTSPLQGAPDVSEFGDNLGKLQRFLSLSTMPEPVLPRHSGHRDLFVKAVHHLCRLYCHGALSDADKEDTLFRILCIPKLGLHWSIAHTRTRIQICSTGDINSLFAPLASDESSLYPLVSQPTRSFSNRVRNIQVS